jgi:hypothetical protein
MVRETKQPPSARHRLMIGVARAVEAYWRDSRSGAAGGPLPASGVMQTE